MEGFGGGVFFAILGFAFIVIAFFVLIAIRSIQKSAAESDEQVNRAIRAAGTGPGPRREGIRRRTNARRNGGDDEDEEEFAQNPDEPMIIEGEDDYGEEDYDENDPMAKAGKIGAKKMRKLEMKEEKRRMREFELQEREERKKKQEEADAIRRMEDEKEAAVEKAREDAERLEKERREKQEHEEYLKMKASFEVEEEGCDADFDEDETQNRLQQFIDYIKDQKVVQLDELAGHFNMRTQDVITRVQELLQQGQLIGVIDDRGKFIYITNEELQSVAKFIRQRGRVSITDLAENSNNFINLVPAE